MRASIKFFGNYWLTCFIWFNAYTQCPLYSSFQSRILEIEGNNSLSRPEKLQVFYELKKNFQRCKYAEDSILARINLKIGKYEFLVNMDYQLAIQQTIEALRVNRLAGKSGSKAITINSNYNLGCYYQALKYYGRALAHYDTAIVLCRNFEDRDNYAIDSRFNKSDILFLTGDYQKAVEEAMMGLELSKAVNDSSSYLTFLNRKAQSLCFENNLEQSLDAANAALELAIQRKETSEQATALKILGFISEKKHQVREANDYFKRGVQKRILNNNASQIASDYNDWGNFFLNSKADYQNAEKCYRLTLAYANRMANPIDRSLKIALANVNLGASSLKQNKLQESSGYYMKVFENLNLDIHNNINENPQSADLGKVSNKDLVFELMEGKTLLHLKLFKERSRKSDLDACIRTAIITDSVITLIRHDHVAELSKLLWRIKTRSFYSLALQAAFEKNDPALAFYFMEKSQAVLLNDKLNELGAASHLPAPEASNEERLQVSITSLHLKLSGLNDHSVDYSTTENKLLEAKSEYELFIKSLEKKYPLYYQNKYADDVPSLAILQEYLAKENQGFVHYFASDTSTYVLAVTKASAKLSRLPGSHFSSKVFADFLRICSDKTALNLRFKEYAEISHSIYKVLFQPLNIPKGRVIICADNFLIPFEALSATPDGKNFLVNDYAFSYVYSARYMLKEFKENKPKGDFLGIAPVSFAPYLRVADLVQSGDAIKTASEFYNRKQLLLENNASCINFLKQLPGYTVVGIFSHASADSSQEEPTLCMADSLIYLSQLQVINNPATRLVILSACETNAGRNATGEGIYSLARGFALAGIPAVTATMWKADESTIYSITELFNKNLAAGMNKDQALQQAKISFLTLNKNDKQLPWYWANMVLIGNTDPLTLSSGSRLWWWLFASGILLFIGIFRYLQKKRPHNAMAN